MNAVPDFLLAAPHRQPAAANTSSSSPDAELLRICAEFIELEMRVRAIYDGSEAEQDDDAADTAACDVDRRMALLLLQMEALHATTLLGVHARGLVLAHHNRDFAFSFDDETTMAGRLLMLLMRDAMALEQHLFPNPSVPA